MHVLFAPQSVRGSDAQNAVPTLRCFQELIVDEPFSTLSRHGKHVVFFAKGFRIINLLTSYPSIHYFQQIIQSVADERRFALGRTEY